ncbi:hypothetical protein WM33_12450 [Burkholderia multivorans]|nr:hypothetical protein WM33_12450 [Burkholderia multivorans]KVZ77406.1 hypothetical protein WL23_21150 [Burkholderia multivorans]
MQGGRAGRVSEIAVSEPAIQIADRRLVLATWHPFDTLIIEHRFEAAVHHQRLSASLFLYLEDPVRDRCALLVVDELRLSRFRLATVEVHIDATLRAVALHIPTGDLPDFPIELLIH